MFSGGATLEIGSGYVWGVTLGETSSGIVVLSGGVVDVLAGGTVVGPIVEAGGALVVSGGTLSGAITNSGTITFSGGGGVSGTISGNGSVIITGGGPVEFSNAAAVTISGVGNILEIDNASQFSSSGDVISGFAPDNVIELKGITFHSGNTVQLLSGNVLLVSANGSSYDLHLDPLANYGGSVFTLFSAASGTFITFNQQPVVSGGTAIVSSGVVSNLLVLSGGTDEVQSGATATATTVLLGGIEFVNSRGVTSGTVVSGGTFPTEASQIVSSGGTAVGTTIDSGGSGVISAGGTASMSVLSGGEQTVYGVALSTTLNGFPPC